MHFHPLRAGLNSTAHHQATIETMANRKEDSRIQEAGLVALEHVVTKSFATMSEGVDAVGAAGGLHATLDAIRQHPDDYQIALQARSAGHRPARLSRKLSQQVSLLCRAGGVSCVGAPSHLTRSWPRVEPSPPPLPATRDRAAPSSRCSSSPESWRTRPARWAPPAPSSRSWRSTSRRSSRRRRRGRS